MVLDKVRVLCGWSLAEVVATIATVAVTAAAKEGVDGIADAARGRPCLFGVGCDSGAWPVPKAAREELEEELVPLAFTGAAAEWARE